MNAVEIAADDSFTDDELRELYASVGWSAYTQDVAALVRAIRNSTYVVSARSDGRLIGLARVMSDDVSICYVQDILVRPDYQHQGIGTRLLSACLERFSHARQKVLITDDEEAQHRFYRSMGFTDLTMLSEVDLHAFVQIVGVT